MLRRPDQRTLPASDKPLDENERPRLAKAKRFSRDGAAGVAVVGILTGSVPPPTATGVLTGGKNTCPFPRIAPSAWSGDANPPNIDPNRKRPPSGSVRPPPAFCETL